MEFLQPRRVILISLDRIFFAQVSGAFSSIDLIGSAQLNERADFSNIKLKSASMNESECVYLYI